MKNVYPQIENSFVYTCVSEEKWTYEQFVPEHILAWQISGETHIYHQQGTWSVGFIGNIYLQPTDVSFNNCTFQEGAVDDSFPECCLRPFAGRDTQALS